MVQELQLSENKEVLTSSKRPKAVWKVCYSYDDRTSFYLTDKEKNFFVRELSKGNKFVDIKGNLLGANFLHVSLDEYKTHKEILDNKRNDEDRYAIDESGNRFKI